MCVCIRTHTLHHHPSSKSTTLAVKHILLDCTVFSVNKQQFYSEMCLTDVFKNKIKIT